jgi:thiol-disulfide isomerase/thioredoxin
LYILSYLFPTHRFSFPDQQLLQSAKIATIFRRLFGISPELSAVAMDSARETALAYIKNNPVMVFSKSYCPYCDKTKTLLKNKSAQIGFKYKVIELDQMGGKGSPNAASSAMPVR